MIGTCKTKCWDGHKTKLYYPGDQDDIDPNGEMAIHFDFKESIPRDPVPQRPEPPVEVMVDVPVEPPPKRMNEAAMRAKIVAQLRREGLLKEENKEEIPENTDRPE